VDCIVQKFGGTSLADLERIRRAAARSVSAHRAGKSVVVVVSAMAGQTNKLLALGRELGPGLGSMGPREMDTLAASGEQVTAALMSLAIQAQEVKARSFLGHQVRILTDSAFTKARIRVIDASELRQTLESGGIAVVAGFQGVDGAGNITTLGRGGSDTTAVALAVALGAAECEIYTDVEGLFTADPNICPAARKIERIAHEEMLEMASMGAKILQIRSVELAMKYNVTVHVRSSFSDNPGTLVVRDEEGLEALVVSGVTDDPNEARINALGLQNTPDVLARLFKPLADDNISVDLIVQTLGVDGKMNVAFSLNKDDLPRAVASVRRVLDSLGGHDLQVDPEVVKVSIVGLAMRTHAGVAQKMFALLSDAGIPILLAVSTEIKVSCLVPSRYRELAVRLVHEGFGLSAPAGGPVPLPREA
jgi:aspartate kinase